uniref:Cytochrome b6-f complex subunit 4 n=1 Tax=Lygus hesperus TaxID=30085 RepID=A0A0A9XMY4_LYGHE
MFSSLVLTIPSYSSAVHNPIRTPTQQKSFLITYLEEYKRDPSQASLYLAITLYDELASKGIVLVRYVVLLVFAGTDVHTISCTQTHTVVTSAPQLHFLLRIPDVPSQYFYTCTSRILCTHIYIRSITCPTKLISTPYLKPSHRFQHPIYMRYPTSAPLCNTRVCSSLCCSITVGGLFTCWFSCRCRH